MFDDIQMGSSIAVSGVCLSVVEFDAKTMRFDMVPETLQKTKLGQLHSGDTVNLERAMKAGARFEGHVVQGHVEGTGEVVEPGPNLHIRTQNEIKKFLIHKGSITIDGVSLTIASVTDDGCTVALIPHTMSVTTLGSLRNGDPVNLETDILIRAVLQKA